MTYEINKHLFYIDNLSPDISNVRILCVAGSMHLLGVCLQVCCCGPGRQEISIDFCTAHGNAACESGQCHVVSVCVS